MFLIKDVLFLDKKLDEGGFNIFSCDLEYGIVEVFLECILLGFWVFRKENIKGKIFLLLNVILEVKSFIFRG